ncbi:hypothetical protein [Porphyromonas endodontalis]|nr:hypothetical protein [Porphyromonas endodontalis]
MAHKKWLFVYIDAGVPSVALSPQHTEPSFSAAVLSILFIKKNDK